MNGTFHLFDIPTCSHCTLTCSRPKRNNKIIVGERLRGEIGPTVSLAESRPILVAFTVIARKPWPELLEQCYFGYLYRYSLKSHGCYFLFLLFVQELCDTNNRLDIYISTPFLTLHHGFSVITENIQIRNHRPTKAHNRKEVVSIRLKIRPKMGVAKP